MLHHPRVFVHAATVHLRVRVCDGPLSSLKTSTSVELLLLRNGM